MNNRSSLDYIFELRTRLLRCLMVFAVVAVIFMPFANALYHILAKPLLSLLPYHSTFIATALPTTFFIPLKFSLLTAIMVCIPFIFYQVWNFIAPALYQTERRWAWLLLIFSVLLFYVGITFAYFVVFPLLFKFFIQTTPSDVLLFPDISSYLSLTMQLFFAFGFAFEVPIIIIGLHALGIVELKTIASKRRYFIVAAFIIAMFITPPDVVSQTLLAVPLCLLFEIGLLGARYITPYIQSHEHSTPPENTVS